MAFGHHFVVFASSNSLHWCFLHSAHCNGRRLLIWQWQPSSFFSCTSHSSSSLHSPAHCSSCGSVLSCLVRLVFLSLSPRLGHHGHLPFNIFTTDNLVICVGALPISHCGVDSSNKLLNYESYSHFACFLCCGHRHLLWAFPQSFTR